MGICQADIRWGEKETAIGETLGGEGGKWGLWSALCPMVMSVEQREGMWALKGRKRLWQGPQNQREICGKVGEKEDF